MYVDTLGTFVNATLNTVESTYAPVVAIVSEYVPADAISHDATHWFEAMLYELHAPDESEGNDIHTGPFVNIVPPHGFFHV